MIPSEPGRRREPAVNIPPLLLVWIAILIVVQAIRAWLPETEDVQALLDFSFIPAPWSIAGGWASADDVIRVAEQAAGDGPSAELRVTLARYVSGQPAEPWTPLTYVLLHGSWTHVGLNCIWLVAFGSSVMKRAGGWRSTVLAAATAIGGAIAQWISDPLGVQPVIGASAVVSGFMAAAATFMFVRPHVAFWRPPDPYRRWSFLTNRNALVFLGVWFVANLLFGLLAQPLGLADGAAVAWQAHIGGLLAGLLVFPLIDPGPPQPPRSDEAFGS